MPPDTDPHRLLAATGRPWYRRALWLAPLLLVLLAAAWLALRNSAQQQGPHYLSTEARRGDLTVTVSASGNLQPIQQVDVGSELSGTIDAVLVEENDRVTKGQVLARLDARKLKDQVAKSRAALESAQAQVLQARATVREADAQLGRLREVARLSGGKVPSKAELDTAEASLLRAQADEAAARAAVSQAKATLSTDETNLAKAIIVSPIDGVVLTRKVERGQTVAATMTTPVLYTLAEDLSKMELQVKVDEADVGQVQEGQSATFNVDAYPKRKYPATVTRVDLGSTTTDNVVSYLTILQVANDDLSLRPGMTATADILTEQRQDALLVPNAALRFTPPAAATEEKRSLIASLMLHSPRQQSPRRNGTQPGDGAAQRLWVLENGQARQIEVVIGVSDGRSTEIVSGSLQPGMQVITDVQDASR